MNMRYRPSFWAILGLSVAVLTLIADQASKQFFMELLLSAPVSLPVTRFFSLVPVWNKGVSFGLLSNHDGWGAFALAALSVGVAAFLIGWLHRVKRRLTACALGLIIGGALGNGVDRVRFGAVFDFLDFSLGFYHWPAFNLADSAIVAGAVGLILESFLTAKPSKQQ